MDDLTYTAKGTFNRDGKAIINICIPAASKPDRYITDIYNLSKITNDGSINAIFCHFSTNNSAAIQHNSFDYRLHLDAYALKSHAGAVDFDECDEDALFIFFHNDKFERIDREYYFRELEVIYDIVKNRGNHCQDDTQNTNAALNNPRKVGLSLVTKLAL